MAAHNEKKTQVSHDNNLFIKLCLSLISPWQKTLRAWTWSIHFCLSWAILQATFSQNAIPHCLFLSLLSYIIFFWGAILLHYLPVSIPRQQNSHFPDCSRGHGQSKPTFLLSSLLTFSVFLSPVFVCFSLVLVVLLRRFTSGHFFGGLESVSSPRV